MTLESILGNIMESPGSSKPNSNYTSAKLTETSDFIKKFSEIDTRTGDGLDKYRKTTGQPIKGISSSKITLTYRQIKDALDEGFTGYIDKHIRPITGELNEEMQLNIGYSFCPDETSTSKKYEAVRTSVCTAKKTIEIIQQDSEKYIKEIIEKAPDFMKGIIGRLPDEVCKIDAQDAQMNAFKSIGEYGSEKFVVDTYVHQKLIKTEINNEFKKLEEEGQKLRTKMKPYMNAEEEELREKELREKDSKAKNPNELMGAIANNAIAIIKKEQKKSS